MEKRTIEVSVERYEELVKKEALFDKLMEKKDISLYVYERVEEVGNA